MPVHGTSSAQSKKPTKVSAKGDGFSTGPSGSPVTINGLKAQPLGVNAAIQKAQGDLDGTTWGGDVNKVAAYRFNAKDVQAALKDDTALKRFLVEATLAPALGSNADDSILDGKGNFDPSQITLTPLGKGDVFNALHDWMKGDAVTDDELKQLEPSMRAVVGALASDPNAKLYKVEGYLPGTDDDVGAIVSVNSKTGQVNMLTGYYAAG